MKAECQCGRLTVELPGPTPAVVACHCIACQRRSGSPFGLMAYYPADRLTIGGEARRYERPTDEGNTFETFFCPTCGSTVYARAGKHPTMIGVAVGDDRRPRVPAAGAIRMGADDAPLDHGARRRAALPERPRVAFPINDPNRDGDHVCYRGAALALASSIKGVRLVSGRNWSL
jgi:hypothetical protein